MVTRELRNKIDALWDAFAAGGLVNPLEVIEQVTYLRFGCFGYHAGERECDAGAALSEYFRRAGESW